MKFSSWHLLVISVCIATSTMHSSSHYINTGTQSYAFGAQTYKTNNGQFPYVTLLFYYVSPAATSVLNMIYNYVTQVPQLQQNTNTALFQIVERAGRYIIPFDVQLLAEALEVHTTQPHGQFSIVNFWLPQRTAKTGHAVVLVNLNQSTFIAQALARNMFNVKGGTLIKNMMWNYAGPTDYKSFYTQLSAPYFLRSGSNSLNSYFSSLAHALQPVARPYGNAPIAKPPMPQIPSALLLPSTPPSSSGFSQMKAQLLSQQAQPKVTYPITQITPNAQADLAIATVRSNEYGHYRDVVIVLSHQQLKEMKAQQFARMLGSQWSVKMGGYAQVEKGRGAITPISVYNLISLRTYHSYMLGDRNKGEMPGIIGLSDVAWVDQHSETGKLLIFIHVPEYVPLSTFAVKDGQVTNQYAQSKLGEQQTVNTIMQYVKHYFERR